MATNGSVNDIGVVLETLRAEINARWQNAPDAEQSALDQQMGRAMEQVEITRVVSAHWPLEGRNLLERAWLFVHKVVRRSLRWYIDPIVEQQNGFNDTSVRTLRLLVDSYADLGRQIHALTEPSDKRDQQDY